MNRPSAAITTSWDDGHPLDLRIAEMLQEHGLSGTFYVPKRWQRPTMDDAQLRELSDGGFELGGHTIDHVVLTQTADDEAATQIRDSQTWLSSVTGQTCQMFCPPTGRFNPSHRAMIAEAGFTGFRTVELWSIDPPRPSFDGLVEMPTSLQAQPHGKLPILRNIVKRRSTGNFIRFARMGQTGDWLDQLERLANAVASDGGVLHLWGHSWEVEEFNQWNRLSEAFAMLGSMTDQMPAMTNGELCQGYSSDSTNGTGG